MQDSVTIPTTPLLDPAETAALVARWQAVKQPLPAHVTLLAVSKTKPATMIAALAAQGQSDFGENYVQEALTKIAALKTVTANGQPLVWHYIGHIQRNKTRDLAEHFDWVHGVDRLIIAERLNDQRPDTLSPLNVCIQVNIDDEASKSGCQPDALPDLVRQISNLRNLRLRGLMIIPAKDSQTAFTATKALFDSHRQYHAYPEDWDTLSMGMSGDIDQAIQAGATLVRVGTAIFGTRAYPLTDEQPIPQTC